MSKFQSLYNEYASQIDEALQPGVQQQAVTTNEAPAAAAEAGNVQPQVPTQQEAAPPAPVTSEGKKFLVELALKALAVDPDTLTSADKALFSTQITTDNADQVLKQIQTIVDLYS